MRVLITKLRASDSTEAVQVRWAALFTCNSMLAVLNNVLVVCQVYKKQMLLLL